LRYVPLFLLAASAMVMAQDQRLPRLDVFGNKGGRKPPLGFEGTPADPKKAPKAEKKATGQTEITSLAATFDQRARQAVFIGNVVVSDPEFNVTCDRLTAVLKNTKVEGSAPAEPSPGTPPNGGVAKGGGGLEKAIAEAAEGKEVVITQDKLEADGTITKNVGRGRKATYDAKTGDIILSGSPSVQQGINLCVAKADDTVMTLNRNGFNHVDGPSMTVIKDKGAADLR
jgi:lipopolysaccharide export system protein LptA